MTRFKRIQFFLLLQFLLAWTMACSNEVGDDDAAARAAFNDSEIVIDRGSIDELDYEVRETALRITNPTTYSATLTQYDGGHQIVDVSSIRTETTTEFISSLLNNDNDGIETHRFIHEDAYTGEVFFKGEYSVVAEVINIILETLIGTSFAAQATICFFSSANDRKSHLLEQLENNVEDCFATAGKELALAKGSILDSLGTIALLVTTSSTKKTIQLRALAD
ncbi:MAG: hypothetical protein HQM13_02990 [SAR324 cluster bacterium]|nr:hypothetical protein [SAR324 cluster bacterium]